MTRRLRDNAWLRAGAEALLLTAAYLLYSALRVVVEGSEGRAVGNAFHLVSIEQNMGLFHEESVQRAVESQPWLQWSMEMFYKHVYLPLLVIAAVVVFVRDRNLYSGYRTTLLACMAAGLLIFALLPVAPPRMLPEYGFLDPMHSAISATRAEKNDFAAVPSYHFGFTLLAALGLAHSFHFRPWVCALAVLLPSLMLLAIVSTANHFFLDAAAGAAIVMAGWWLFVYRGITHPVERTRWPQALPGPA